MDAVEINDSMLRGDVTLLKRIHHEQVPHLAIFEQFAADERTWSAVLYQISVIGEAVKRLSESFRAQHPSMPWPQMAGMRKKVIHGYDAVGSLREQ